MTDSDGTILIGNVTPGTTLVVRETRTLPGYILDTTPQTAVVREGRTTTLTVRNQPKGTLILYKKNGVTGAAMSGVQFRITNSNGEYVTDADGALSSAGLYTTDDAGQIVLSGLMPDTYIVTEIATLPGFILDSAPHSIVVNAGDTQTLTLTNRIRGGLILLKLDRQTRQPLAGAQFRIVPVNEDLLSNNEGLTSATGLYETGADGQIVLSGLTPGAYVITETAAPDGYNINTEPQTIYVRENSVQTVNFYDGQLTTLRIFKRDSLTHRPIAGAEFIVRSADGTPIGENGGVYVTGADGYATVTNLTPNAAIVVAEQDAPSGYVKDMTPKTVIVRSGSANTVTFDNTPKTTLLIRKIVAETQNTPLADVEFRVVRFVP